MRPTNPAEVRAFLNRRADSRPRDEAPVVRLAGTVASIRLFDPIDSYGGWWGMSAKEFAVALDALPANVDTIELLINSPGGDAFDGLAIVNVMRAHPARTVAVVQGLAASAASYIACAADETVMAANSTLMIHDAWSYAGGNAAELREVADVLDKLSSQLADIYAAKAGTDAAEWRTAMEAETWYTADEAVTAGLADRVEAPSADPEPAAPDALAGQFITRADVLELLAAAAPVPDPKIADQPVDVPSLNEARLALLGI